MAIKHLLLCYLSIIIIIIIDESPTDKVKPTKFSRSLAALAVYCQTKHFVSFNHSQGKHTSV
jgi:hypothetical protein